MAAIRTLSRGSRPVGRDIVVIQPYVPKYRVPLFDLLGELLAADGRRLQVLVPQYALSDERHDAAWPRYVRVVQGWRRRNWPQISYTRAIREAVLAECVVAPLQGSSLENYPIALRARSFALWGHGADFTRAAHALDQQLEQWLLRKADHYFTYTDGGVATGLSAGVDSGRITVLQNTTDTVALRESVEAVDPADVRMYREKRGIVGPVGLCLGALDESKRLPLLFSAADEIRASIPNFTLIFAGDGPMEKAVETFCLERDWVHWEGHVDGEDKALLARTASILINPGRVGLIAADSFGMGIPIATTAWRFHAPEFEYLDDDCALVTGDSETSFAQGVVGLLRNEVRRELMAAAARSKAGDFSVDMMARRFHRGLQSMFAPDAGDATS
jgi:glycosyltransferase involved in cell wall biosynthesis